jgi:hypothetical protein
VFAVPLGELDGLSTSVTQIIQLGPPGLAASDWLDIEDVGRMQGEDSFHALVIDDPPDSKGFVNAPAFARNYHAGKYLRSLFIALFNTAINLDYIAYLEVRDFGLETLALNGI